MAKALAKEAERAEQSKHRRRFKEEVEEVPPPVKSNLYCALCKIPIRLPDLLDHAAENNRKEAIRKLRKLIAASKPGKQKSTPV